MVFWCQNGGALKLKRYIEMKLFNGLLAKKTLNQTGASEIHGELLNH